MYCCPVTASDVLVIDPITNTTKMIPTGLPASAEVYLAEGIVATDDKLYCAPYGLQRDVLVIDPVLEVVDTIPTGLTGSLHYRGIAAVDGKVYCAPYNADVVLTDVAAIVDERMLLESLGI